MNEQKKIIFSNRAFNSIVSETYDKIKTETGGILLGRIIDSIWYVVEVIDPGPNSIFTITYFEYDTPYVNHLAKAISKQYKIELAVLGLWHRHPGSMDTFSSTDDLTNSEFSRLLPQGAISGLINIDPDLRLTIYHVSLPLKYTKTSFEVGDSLFPDELLKYKFSIADHKQQNKEKIKNEIPITPSKTVNPRKGLLNKLSKLVSNFRKTTTIIINNYPTAENSIPQNKSIDIDFLIELYSKEELQLENTLQVNYESEIRGRQIFYSVKDFKNGTLINPRIEFQVSTEITNPTFLCDNKAYKFKEGIFSRYVESKINQTEFTN